MTKVFKTIVYLSSIVFVTLSGYLVKKYLSEKEKLKDIKESNTHNKIEMSKEMVNQSLFFREEVLEWIGQKRRIPEKLISSKGEVVKKVKEWNKMKALKYVESGSIEEARYHVELYDINLEETVNWGIKKSIRKRDFERSLLLSHKYYNGIKQSVKEVLRACGQRGKCKGLGKVINKFLQDRVGNVRKVALSLATEALRVGRPWPAVELVKPHDGGDQIFDSSFRARVEEEIKRASLHGDSKVVMGILSIKMEIDKTVAYSTLRRVSRVGNSDIVSILLENFDYRESYLWRVAKKSANLGYIEICKYLISEIKSISKDIHETKYVTERVREVTIRRELVESCEEKTKSYRALSKYTLLLVKVESKEHCKVKLSFISEKGKRREDTFPKKSMTMKGEVKIYGIRKVQINVKNYDYEGYECGDTYEDECDAHYEGGKEKVIEYRRNGVGIEKQVLETRYLSDISIALS